MYTKIYNKTKEKYVNEFYAWGSGGYKLIFWIKRENGSSSQNTSVVANAITYDEESDVFLFRDDLYMEYDYIRKNYNDNPFLDKEIPLIYGKDCYLCSLFYYVDFDGNIVSDVYSDASNMFYQMPDNPIWDIESYNQRREEIIKEIIVDLKTKSENIKEKLLERVRGELNENTKC